MTKILRRQEAAPLIDLGQESRSTAVLVYVMDRPASEPIIERPYRIRPLAGHGVQVWRARIQPMSDALCFRSSALLHCGPDFRATPPMRKPKYKADTCFSREEH